MFFAVELHISIAPTAAPTTGSSKKTIYGNSVTLELNGFVEFFICARTKRSETTTESSRGMSGKRI